MSNLAWALISSRATKRNLTSFKRQIGLLLESSVNATEKDWAGEDIVQVILDPSILLSWCEVKDE